MLNSLSRRQLLRGLAAASTAVAVPSAAAAIPETENDQLLRLGDKLPSLVAEHGAAVARRRAIIAEWSPRWPRAPEALNLGYHDAYALERDLTGRPFSVVNRYGEDRGRSILTAEHIQLNIRCYQGQVRRARTDPTRESARERLAPWPPLLPIAEAYEAECERVRKASGIEAATARRDAAMKALESTVEAIMAEQPRTMAGVMVQAQAIDTWMKTADGFGRIMKTPDWSAALAASILRISSEHA